MIIPHLASRIPHPAPVRLWRIPHLASRIPYPAPVRLWRISYPPSRTCPPLADPVSRINVSLPHSLFQFPINAIQYACHALFFHIR